VIRQWEGRPYVPVPLKPTVWGLPPPLSLTETLAVRLPLVAGMRPTEKVQQRNPSRRRKPSNHGFLTSSLVISARISDRLSCREACAASPRFEVSRSYSCTLSKRSRFPRPSCKCFNFSCRRRIESLLYPNLPRIRKNPVTICSKLITFRRRLLAEK
jgi:hypothetical protein